VSDYVVESGASARARARRRRALITLLVVVLILFGAFWFAYSYWKKPPAPSAGSTPTCQIVKTVAKPVKINVYNATTRTGLAASTAEALKLRGYVIGTVANDPLKKSIKASAEIRYGKAGVTVAGPVLGLVARPTKVVDKRKDTSVDFVLGNGFKALTPVPTATSTLPVCTTTSAPAKKPSATTTSKAK
jgi:hypothetical protein